MSEHNYWTTKLSDSDVIHLSNQKKTYTAEFKSILAPSKKSAATKLHPGTQIHMVQADSSLPVSEEVSSDPHIWHIKI